MRTETIITATTVDDVRFDPYEQIDGVIRFGTPKTRVLTPGMGLMDPEAQVGKGHVQINLTRAQAVNLALSILDSFNLVPVDLDPTPENERF